MKKKIIKDFLIKIYINLIILSSKKEINNHILSYLYLNKL